MFFYRYNVGESHLNKFCRELHGVFLSGQTIKTATVGGLEIHKTFDDTDGAWIYFLVDANVAKSTEPKPKNTKPTLAIPGFVALSKIKRWVGMEVEILYVSQPFRGQGIASALYEGVMKDGVILISGNRQNQKSRKLWLKMATNEKLTVWAHDLLDLKRYEPICIDDDGEIYCKLKLYDDIKKRRRVKRQDIRFIAMNPRYVK